MAVLVSCPRCGDTHPSRIRARSARAFADLNPHLGAVLEPCPVCGHWSVCRAADRLWSDAVPSTADEAFEGLRAVP